MFNIYCTLFSLQIGTRSLSFLFKTGSTVYYYQYILLRYYITKICLYSKHIVLFQQFVLYYLGPRASTFYPQPQGRLQNIDPILWRSNSILYFESLGLRASVFIFRPQGPDYFQNMDPILWRSNNHHYCILRRSFWAPGPVYSFVGPRALFYLETWTLYCGLPNNLLLFW